MAVASFIVAVIILLGILPAASDTATLWPALADAQKGSRELQTGTGPRRALLEALLLTSSLLSDCLGAFVLGDRASTP